MRDQQHRGRHHGGPHDHPSRSFGERRFARDPLDAGDRFGGRHPHPGGRHGTGHRGAGHEGASHEARGNEARGNEARGNEGRGRRRLFDHGDLRFILLSMIAARPAHGYDLIKALEDRMGGGYSPSPGVIYPTLTMLEEQGFASVAAEDGKKLYRATADGEAFLQANQASVQVIQTRIDAIARDRSVVPDPRIIRAIENLKTALRLRLAGGPIADERVRIIASAIDAAAAEAEQL